MVECETLPAMFIAVAQAPMTAPSFTQYTRTSSILTVRPGR